MTTPSGPVTWVVVSAAPPAVRIHELLAQLHTDPRLVVVATTATAAAWIDEAQVRPFTAWPVRSTPRSHDEPKIHPEPDLVVAAPLTFNTINKWAAGINDNPALGVLNEALGNRIPIIAAPVTNAALAAHPAFARSLDVLAAAGVRLTATNAIVPASPTDGYHWQPVLDLIAEVTPGT
jgi:Phosphopantothenoylcysteine synthetase/decarboxylase